MERTQRGDILDLDFGQGRIVPVNLEHEMKNSYIDYAMSVIVARALPDVRDGLKPVHRRILYAMQGSGMTSNKPYKKSARIVGEVLGKYHPHGDSSVYDAIVRMAQDFSMRYMLADGHGNFGSVDGDSAAAREALEAAREELGFRSLHFNPDIGILSLVGAGMRSNPGVSARLFGSLSEAGVNIHMISTSEIRISVVVDDAVLDEAVRAVHSAFGLDAQAAEAVVYGGTGR